MTAALTGITTLDDVLAFVREAGAQPYGQRLSTLAEEAPDRTALVAVSTSGDETVVTRRELDDLATRTAHVLAAAGVDADSVVAGAVPNGVDIVALGFATWKLGACFLPVNPKMPEPERDAVLDLVAPTLTVVEDGGVVGRPSLTVSELRGRRDEAPSDGFEPRIPMPGKMIASGGSTGRPKIIVTETPYVWLDEWALLVGNALGTRPGQRHLVSGPVYHNWQYDLCFNGLAGGGEVVLMTKFDAALAVDLIERHRIQYAGLVPTTMRRIAHLPDLDPSRLDSLEAICHTAAPCPPALKREWLELLGPERVYELYGAAENIGLTVVRGDEWLERPSTVGRPLECEVVIVDEDGAILPPGEIGTVYVRKPDPTTLGRYEGAAALDRLEDGAVSVGDLGWLDEDGFLFLADRRKDLIITGGVNVYPAEVEAVLAEHPDVAEAIVVGIDDDEWGKRVHAIVELRAGADEDAEAIRSFCRDRLSPPKVPKTVEFVDDIPRSDAGKARRTQLGQDRSGA
ncbi:MAG TPA: AMP-binding protein [Nitriliruptorales bacterium]